MIKIIVSSKEEKEAIDNVFSSIDRHMDKSLDDCGLTAANLETYNELSIAEIVIVKE